MTTTIINPTATNSSVKQNVSFNTTTVFLLAGAIVAVAATLVSLKIGILLLGAVLVGGAYTAYSELETVCLDFELENDLMTEIVAELEQCNH